MPPDTAFGLYKYAHSSHLTHSIASPPTCRHTAVCACQSSTVAALLAKGASPLAACPDVYPSLSKWRLQRGLQAMHVSFWVGSTLLLGGLRAGWWSVGGCEPLLLL